VGLFVSYYARGYKLDLRTFKFQPNGILVLKSEPDGASVYINGELKLRQMRAFPFPLELMTWKCVKMAISPGTKD